jgi:VWFA-related protein
MFVLVRILLGSLLLGAVSMPAAAQSEVAPAAGATFKSGIDMVTVSAVVRDRKGRIVKNLRRSDFELLDSGVPRPIKDFRPDQAAISVAVLVDGSGSMQVADKIVEARAAAQFLFAWLDPRRDEVGIFSFDTGLYELRPFATADEPEALHASLSRVEPFGMTSLHDAVAATARVVAERGNIHRAVIVLTDGVDNGSRLTPAEVSGIASSIDVPVYIVAVVSPLDHAGAATAVRSERPVPVGDLADLARWTGGELFVSSGPTHTSQATREIVNELRHQYLIAFEPGTRPGWHPLEVRTRKGNLIVRARSGYMAGQAQD